MITIMPQNTSNDDQAYVCLFRKLQISSHLLNNVLFVYSYDIGYKYLHKYFRLYQCIVINIRHIKFLAIFILFKRYTKTVLKRCS